MDSARAAGRARRRYHRLRRAARGGAAHPQGRRWQVRALSGEGGVDAAPSREVVPEEVVEATLPLAWLDRCGRVDATFEHTFGDGSRASGMTLLMVAMASGRKKLAEEILRRGADVSLQNSNGSYALGLAAANGYAKLVELVLRHGAEVDQRNKVGSTALMQAAYNRREQIVDTLIRHGAAIDMQDSVGGTALMAVAYKGHERIVDMLVRHSAEIDLQAKDGGTALMQAAFHGQPAALLRLLRAGADMTLRDAAGKTALQYAKEKGQAECVEAFRTYLGEVAAVRSKSPSAEAGGAGASGAPADAAAAGASAAASASSGEGAEAEPGSGTVPEEVVLAARRGEEVAVLAWLEGGGRVDERFECDFGDGSRESGISLLMVAMINGHEGLAEALIQRGADVSLQTRCGVTALMFAAANGREKLVELALRHGAEIDQRHCTKGGTALTGRRLWPRADCRHAHPARRGDQSAGQRRRHCADYRRVLRPRADYRYADPKRRRDQPAAQRRRHCADFRRALRSPRRHATAAAGGRRYDAVH